jgi:hypothetical protein
MKVRMLTGALVLPACWAAVDFNREIRPILSENCFTCHGPDEGQRQAGLRLDTREGALAKVIVPGNAADSLLYQKITHSDPARRMPARSSGRTLTPQQIARLKAWVDEGANWETHWAYVPPRRPEPPVVQNTAWPRNPIDRFVLARLEREGLKPSPEAERITLLRRLHLDLTGLPPQPADLAAFDTYEKAVDRLLASTAHAERLALQWLDLARYADTHGYHIDSHRDMWPWRDWVIRAFARNLPYDQFTLEQLAGDLLPNATLDQKIASGFNRNHMINYEGGAIPDEYLNEYVADRVETFSTIWLGQTLNCARCHDHKYDPFRIKEFYQLYAFFHNVGESGLDGQRGNAKPFLELPSPDQKRRQEELATAIALREKALPEAGVSSRQREWEKTRPDTLPPPPREALESHWEFDGHLADTSGRYQHGRAARGMPLFEAGQVARALELDGETEVRFGDAARFDRADHFSLALWFRSGTRNPNALLQKTEPASGRRGFELAFDFAELLYERKRGAHLLVHLIHRWPDDALRVRTRERLGIGEWHHLVLTYDGSGRASGLKLYLNGKTAELEVLGDSLTGSVATSAPLTAGAKQPSGPYKGRLDDLRFYRRLLPASEIEQLAVMEPLRALLAQDPAKRSKEDRQRLREYFLNHEAPAEMRRLHAELQALRQEKEDLQKAILTTMVMDERENPRETWVLGRGDYRNRRYQVEPDTPAVLPAFPAGQRRNRLGLARWLVDPKHPLTARVAVNRFWQLYFGTGLVKTVEDFGSQGDPPSHPELLDWLATEFVRSGWDIRALERLIVTSATYRQSSRVTRELLEKDPENRLLARGARFRLPAEILRDNALAISGLLDGRVGGPGVFPYQPAGIWEELAYGDGFTAQEYRQSRGRDLYRRSLYTFWKRTAPPPNMTTFDAPDREKCTARRPVTNTPLQALVLMNDPIFVEAARHLAQRTLAEAARDTSARVRHAFRLATAREPSKVESEALRELLGRQFAQYRRNPKAARELLSVGESPWDSRLDLAELAAWTTVASAILNLDETITRE